MLVIVSLAGISRVCVPASPAGGVHVIVTIAESDRAPTVAATFVGAAGASARRAATVARPRHPTTSAAPAPSRAARDWADTIRARAAGAYDRPADVGARALDAGSSRHMVHGPPSAPSGWHGSPGRTRSRWPPRRGSAWPRRVAHTGVSARHRTARPRHRPHP